MTVIVGFSGGADSTCLLSACKEAGLMVIAAYFNHHIRKDTKDDYGTIGFTCQRLDIPLVVGEGDVPGYARENGLGIEEAARILRYEFLFNIAEQYHASAVLVGHTADDQVETVLMNLLRGSGMDGLSGMPERSIPNHWSHTIALVRPLLAHWRGETESWCIERGLPYLQDSTNQDIQYRRNRVRNELIPYLETYNPRIRESIWQTASVLDAEINFGREFKIRAFQRHLLSKMKHMLVFSITGLRTEDIAVQRWIIRTAIEKFGVRMDEIGFEGISKAVDFLVMPDGAHIQLAERIHVFKEQDEFSIVHGEDGLDTKKYPQITLSSQLMLPNCVCCVGEDWSIELISTERSGVKYFEDNFCVYLDADRMPTELTIRPADKSGFYQPLGMKQAVPVQRYLEKQHIPARARKHYPVICSGEEILWIPGFAPAETKKITSSTEKVICLRVYRKNISSEKPVD